MRRPENNEREIKKKQREIAPCKIVARTINEIENTDYDVPDAEYQLKHCKEPTDVLLQSKASSYPERYIQVTTIPFVTKPSDLELRDDNTNISKLESSLRNTLFQRGLTGLQLDLHLTQSGVLKGVPVRLVNRLVELVQNRPRKEQWSVHEIEISRSYSDLAPFVSDVFGHPLLSGSLFVNAGRGCFIPEDNRSITEAIRGKGESKYSSSALRTLTLVIDAASTILPEQITNYLNNCNPSEIPFSEVWIVHPFMDRAIPLKRRPESSQ